MNIDFPLPDETDRDKMRETFLYMTVRAIMIRNLLDAGVPHEEVKMMIGIQDEIWEGLEGQLAEGWE